MLKQRVRRTANAISGGIGLKPAGTFVLAFSLASCTHVPVDHAAQTRPQQALAQKAMLTQKLMPQSDPAKTFSTFHNRKITSPIAYETPPTPAYIDRPFGDTLPTSLEAADYVAALRAAGLSGLLNDRGPFTILAPSNAAMEQDPDFRDRAIFQPGNRATLRKAISGTVLVGNWNARSIAAALRRSHAGSIRVPTRDGAEMIVSWDAATQRPVFTGAEGRTVILWGDAIQQSNGTLYFTQNLVTPRTPVRQGSRQRALRFW